ncbi:hypothetical protein, conserved [Eimeria tenella]|uniref:Uncharacterized protein n=1 Tax=Eimeria tenella TaxID=5802 RepID=U6KY57_EIMTE|nr:hypothetical protein, conserved [Eimeria tenella]CDJ41883.1 hypothetical protein, conserved [Eimeria tenella]|eukprot:XP_013232633.1 hypothetical protein, conserved [Eimeria tenella]
MKATCNQQTKRRFRHSDVQPMETGFERYVRLLGLDLSEYFYPFENNIDFEEPPTDDKSTPPKHQMEDRQIHSVPPTPPSTPSNRTEGGLSTLGPARDPRPATVSCRTWKQLKKIIERQKKVAEATEPNRAIAIAPEESCGDGVPNQKSNKKEEPEVNNKEEPEVNNKEEPEVNSKKEPEVNNKKEPEVNNKEELEGNNKEELEVNNKEEPEVNSKKEPEVTNEEKPETNHRCEEIQNSHLEDFKRSPDASKAEEFSPPKTCFSRSVQQRSCNFKASNTLKDQKEAPTSKKNAVSWYPVAEVVTVETESPTTTHPVDISTAGLVEKSTLRSCRRIMNRQSPAIGSGSSSSRDLLKD